MKRICDLMTGDRVWYARLLMGKSRCTENHPPEECEINRIKDGYSCLGEFIAIKGKGIHRSYSISDREIEEFGLFETEQGAKDYYNSCIQNEIDKLTSNYERLTRYLKKKILK